jgi:AAA domain/UvrD-like helicase C-terminal domain
MQLTELNEQKSTELNELQLTDIVPLNKLQLKATTRLKKYLSSTHTNFLLLGAAGSGKTTVIVNTFNHSAQKIAFCAFTNKATQVLKGKSDNVRFDADFLTVHKLLALELSYTHTGEIKFNYARNRLFSMSTYDVVIFDECSTISGELYEYIKDAHAHIEDKYAHTIKYIFIGDYWQLPPIGETQSVVFSTAIENVWGVSKLSTIMRSVSEQTNEINQSLHAMINQFKISPPKNFIKNYPYNLITPSCTNTNEFCDVYCDTLRSQPSVVCITYSKKNCMMLNLEIQSRQNSHYSNPAQETLHTWFELDHKFYAENNPYFFANDRCCIDQPVNIMEIKYKQDRVAYYATDQCAVIYSGEIFDIIDATESYIQTPLNKFKGMPMYFKGQILTILDARMNKYQIFHIPKDTLTLLKPILKRQLTPSAYNNLLSDWYKTYPICSYGYALTVYKSQGSEWHTIFVNLSSIKWSVARSAKDSNMLLKTTYTALTRATHVVHTFWF